MPLGIQHSAEGNCLLGETTREVGSQGGKITKGERQMSYIPRLDPGRNHRGMIRMSGQDGTIHFLEKVLRESVESLEWGPLLGRKYSARQRNVRTSNPLQEGWCSL